MEGVFREEMPSMLPRQVDEDEDEQSYESMLDCTVFASPSAALWTSAVEPPLVRFPTALSKLFQALSSASWLESDRSLRVALHAAPVVLDAVDVGLDLILRSRLRIERVEARQRALEGLQAAAVLPLLDGLRVRQHSDHDRKPEAACDERDDPPSPAHDRTSPPSSEVIARP